jgi:hypothetical protein
MSAATYRPTLIKLGDGRVLSIGGDGRDPVNADTGDSQYGTRYPEVYSPTTGEWTDTPAPPWAPATCVGQWAVRLADGRVLVGGGLPYNLVIGNPCAANTAAFDPTSGANGAWENVATIPLDTRWASATLLQDGRVMVVGGETLGGSAVPEVYAYDPDTDDWATLATFNGGIGREPIAITLKDGRILAGGGYLKRDIYGNMTDTGAPQVYNPSTNSWTFSEAPYSGRGQGTMLLPDGRVVIAGAEHFSWNQGPILTLDPQVFIYTPATNTFARLAPFPKGRAAFAFARLPDGSLLAAGGLVDTSGGIEATNTALVYDWATNAWYPAAHMGTARALPGSATLNDGRILVAGGTAASSELYTPGADLAPPGTSTPLTTIRQGATIGSSTVPARVTWTGSDTGSGVKSYDLQRSYDGGAWSTVATGLTTAAWNTFLTVGHRYRFQVRARDNVGHVGAWKAGSDVKPVITQQAASTVLTYGGTWTVVSSSSYSGGSARYASTAGRSVSYTFTGRSIAFVAVRGPGRGSARIYVDGVLQTTINLWASTATYRFVGYSKTWTTSAKHTIKVVVLGTAGHPRIDADAFVTLRNP